MLYLLLTPCTMGSCVALVLLSQQEWTKYMPLLLSSTYPIKKESVRKCLLDSTCGFPVPRGQFLGPPRIIRSQTGVSWRHHSLHSLSLGFFGIFGLLNIFFLGFFVNMRTSAKKVRGPEEPRDPSVSIHLRGLSKTPFFRQSQCKFCFYRENTLSLSLKSPSCGAGVKP